MDLNLQQKFNIHEIIKTPLGIHEGLWCGPIGMYWSNLEKPQNFLYLKDLDRLGSWETMKRYFPQHEKIIFSPKRIGAVATLEFSDRDVVLDAGCMWGALSIPMARTKATVVAVDQTQESLKFLARRKEEENLDNLTLVCADLKQLELHDKVFDKIIINGVLEWIPENENVEVNQFHKRVSLGRKLSAIFNRSKDDLLPYEKQKQWLLNLGAALKDNGTLFLAIENRFDFLYFCGVPEPHCGIRFFAFLPRWLQNIVSSLLRGRPFRNWTYSRTALRELLEVAGFSQVEVYYAFPGYHFPEVVLHDAGIHHFQYYAERQEARRIKRICVRFQEEILCKRWGLTFLAPSFILHCKK